MNEHPSHYTKSPEVPPELMPRLAVIVEVLSGVKTVSDAARELNLSRNHFQTILHRALASMVETLEPKEPGRPAKSQALSELEQRLKRLERENTRLKKRVEATDELLGVAGQLLHGQRQPGQRSRRTRRKDTPNNSGGEDAEPEGWRARVLQAVGRMHELGVTMHRVAQLTGVNEATLRRWRVQRCLATCVRTAVVTPVMQASAELAVRDLHGLVGAAALSHRIEGLSRRAAARIKLQTLCAMEHERKHALTRIAMSAPGVVRGVDAMYLGTHEAPCYALIAADAAVPYRTSARMATRYDSALVLKTLAADIGKHGAPLVLRLDRAKAHGTPEVRALAEMHQILTLHGPPRYPRFYGQLERQNREHRAWLAALADPAGAPMKQLIEQMLHCLNTLWPRKQLGWKTAAEVWSTRTPISIDTRKAFQEEVKDRTRRIACSKTICGQPADLAERLAIEQTLEHMGYLHRQIGGWC
jgi:transposase InsO family protein